MKKYLITDAGVLTTTDGNEVAFFNVAGVKNRVFRNINQIKTDLINSGLLDPRIAHNVTSVYHPSVASLMADFIGGFASGTINSRSAGDDYTVTENSYVMQPTNPKFGDFAVGDIDQVDHDHAQVDGFLNLRRDAEVELIVRTANARANLMADLAGLFGASGATEVADGNIVAEANDELPEDIAKEAGLDTKEEPASKETATKK